MINNAEITSPRYLFQILYHHTISLAQSKV